MPLARTTQHDINIQQIEHGVGIPQLESGRDTLDGWQNITRGPRHTASAEAAPFSQLRVQFIEGTPAGTLADAILGISDWATGLGKSC